jgi:hypothetical protein
LGGQEITRTSTLAKGSTFAPGESVWKRTAPELLEVLEFDENVFRRRFSSSRPKDIWIVMVTKVELSDGSVYDVSAKYRAIEKFVEQIDFNRIDVAEAERRLDSFISQAVGND